MLGQKNIVQSRTRQGQWPSAFHRRLRVEAGCRRRLSRGGAWTRPLTAARTSGIGQSGKGMVQGVNQPGRPMGHLTLNLGPIGFHLIVFIGKVQCRQYQDGQFRHFHGLARLSGRDAAHFTGQRSGHGFRLRADRIGSKRVGLTEKIYVQQLIQP
jgi:hypothetical protein